MHSAPGNKRGFGQRWRGIAMLLAVLLPAGIGWSEGLITLNMRNADINAVVQWIADTTGKRVIVDPRVRGQITILARDPMSPEEAFRVVINAINVYGYTAIEQDGTLSIVPQANLKTGSTEFIDVLTLNQADLPVNQVIRLANLPAEQVANALRPLVPPHANLVALPESNSLLITDSVSNVQRIARLADQLDRNASLQLDVLPLQNASAEELVKVLRQLLGEKDSAMLQMSTDTRVNAIILAGSEEMRAKARDLIERLDRAEVVQGSIKVVYLHYLKASEVLPVLRGMIGAGDEKGANKEPISIEASDATNALIISAPPDRLDALLGVVKKLDIRRAQVLIEAIIAEVDEDVARELGVEWKTAFNGDGVEAISRFANGEIQPPDSPLENVARGLTLGYFRNGSLRALLRALEIDQDNNILSTPSVVTLDHQEAEILVGSNIPVITGQALSGQIENPNGSESTNPFTTIERKDIGISLKVTPQINQGDAITLDILQTVETLTDSTEAEDVITDKRSVHTTVMLGDEDILVLGGLIQDRAVESVQKVPLLGDIPLLGALFRSTSRSTERKNLMVFVRTRILTDLKDADEETRNRYNKVRELQLEYDKPDRDRKLRKETPLLEPLPEPAISAEPQQ